MRRVIAIAAAGMSLAGCSSFSLDYFKPTPPTPPTSQVQLDSTPQGADARTSVGPGCKTPCTAAVQVTKFPGDFTSPPSVNIDPNPVFAELRPAGPPPKPAKKKIMRPKRPRPPKGAAPAPADSAFPAPAPGAVP